ncbi:hypothetical protein BGZ83_010951, partial [Gryganskiella cystojenkinii]
LTQNPSIMGAIPTLNRVAIVTGASRGIGRAIALRLAQDGHNVIVNYNSNPAKAQEVVDLIHSSAKASASASLSRAIAVQADAANIEDSQKLVNAAIENFGRIDSVVFNVGKIYGQTIEAVTEDIFEDAIRTNIKGPTFLTQKVIPHLQPGARLIFLSATLTSASLVLPQHFLYVATKGAIEQMVRSLAKDLGKRGIAVNAVSPGPTDTDSFREGKNDEKIKATAAQHPAGRLGQPEDVARVVSFLASEDAEWVNGQFLRVNGGVVV